VLAQRHDLARDVSDAISVSSWATTTDDVDRSIDAILQAAIAVRSSRIAG
jgi:hypothetical protein